MDFGACVAESQALKLKTRAHFAFLGGKKVPDEQKSSSFITEYANQLVTSIAGAIGATFFGGRPVIQFWIVVGAVAAALLLRVIKLQRLGYNHKRWLVTASIFLAVSTVACVLDFKRSAPVPLPPTVEKTEGGAEIETSPRPGRGNAESGTSDQPRIEVEFLHSISSLGVCADEPVEVTFVDEGVKWRIHPTASMSAEDRLGYDPGDDRFELVVGEFKRGSLGINGVEIHPGDGRIRVGTVQLTMDGGMANSTMSFYTPTWRRFSPDSVMTYAGSDYKSAGVVNPTAEIAEGLAPIPPGDTAWKVDGRDSRAFLRFASTLWCARPNGVGFYIGVRAGEHPSARLVFGTPDGSFFVLQRRTRSKWRIGKLIDGAPVWLAELSLRTAFDAFFQFMDDGFGNCHLFVDTDMPTVVPYKSKAARILAPNSSQFQLTAAGREWPLYVSFQAEGVTAYLRSVLVSTYTHPSDAEARVAARVIMRNPGEYLSLAGD
ncbi:MAG: hypothetical protein J0L72_10375 [Armatimonadetes bacterium]|nr:hypothetical protein [Armatimonadota bacterium]